MLTKDNFLTILHQYPWNKKPKYLLAVSGGVDSMVLSHLFYDSGCEIGIAHVNHHLRDVESDEDAEFVRRFAADRYLPYFQHDVNKTDLLVGNMHDKARKERYAFFQSVAQKNGYDYIVTAHHLDDRIEGFFLNLLRGGGLQGLTSLQPLKGNLFRPLLHFRRQEIEDFADAQNITFREDSSNAKLDYTRNKIRHSLLPLLHSIDPRANDGIELSLRNLESERYLLEEYIDYLREKYMSTDSKYTYIDTFNLGDASDVKLYKLIKEFGFNFSQCQSMIQQGSISGATFEGNGYQALKTEQHIIIRDLNTIKNHDTELIIPELGTYTFNSCMVQVMQLNPIESSEETASVIAVQQVRFPLKLRYKKNGDTFKPASLKGRKTSLKSYLTNRKVHRWDKEDTLVLVDDCGDIIAVIGYELSFSAVLEEKNDQGTILYVKIINM